MLIKDWTITLWLSDIHIYFYIIAIIILLILILDEEYPIVSPYNSSKLLLLN